MHIKKEVMDMQLKATATFDNSEQSQAFSSKIERLGVKTQVRGASVDVVYDCTDNSTKLKLMDMFEEVRRHDIRTYSDY